MTPEEIITIATSGTDAEVVKAYRDVMGQDIANCIPCQKHDARYYLTRYARAMQTQGLTLGLTHRIKKEHLNTHSISGVGVLLPLTATKIVAIQAAGFGYILEEVVPEVIGKAVAEPATPVTPAPDTTPEATATPEANAIPEGKRNGKK